MSCDIIHFIIAHVINVGSGPVHVMGTCEIQPVLSVCCVCMYVCMSVLVSCVALVHGLKHFCCILLVKCDDDGDTESDTMGKYHVRSTPLITIIVYTESIDSEPAEYAEVKQKVI